MNDYFRPLVRNDLPRPADAVPLAGGAGWFTHAEHLRRDGSDGCVPAARLPSAVMDALTRPRAPICGLSLDRPRIMGILNVTPDSFSDGGAFDSAVRAESHGRRMIAEGADMIDIGGESTRPGAQPVPVRVEIERVSPVIAALSRAEGAVVSIDTRKTAVAEAARTAGAALINDVSGFTHDATLAGFCAREALPVCVMHALGDPTTMQDDPRYENVLLDVFDFLAAQVRMLVDRGIPRERIIVDPGIGFGKTQGHNLDLLRNVSLFHGIGCAVLVGASRKKFIGRISGVERAADRVPGSIAVALGCVAQGVQFLRVHDVAQTVHALALWRAVQQGDSNVA